jgi:DNA-binding Xre family transcriptional regulator
LHADLRFERLYHLASKKGWKKEKSTKVEALTKINQQKILTTKIKPVKIISLT